MLKVTLNLPLNRSQGFSKVLSYIFNHVDIRTWKLLCLQDFTIILILILEIKTFESVVQNGVCRVIGNTYF